jgi:hypothetical protein
VRGRAPEYTRTAAAEMRYEEVIKQTEAAEEAQAALHQKLDAVLTNLKKQLVCAPAPRDRRGAFPTQAQPTWVT